MRPGRDKGWFPGAKVRARSRSGGAAGGRGGGMGQDGKRQGWEGSAEGEAGRGEAGRGGAGGLVSSSVQVRARLQGRAMSVSRAGASILFFAWRCQCEPRAVRPSSEISTTPVRRRAAPALCLSAGAARLSHPLSAIRLHGLFGLEGFFWRIGAAAAACVGSRPVDVRRARAG